MEPAPRLFADEPREPVSPRPRRSSLRVWLTALAELAIVAATTYLVVRLASEVGWGGLGDRVSTARGVWLAAAAMALVLRYVAWELRWRLALRRLDLRVGLPLGFASLMTSALVNLVTPSVRLLGGLMRARHLGRELRVPFARVYGVVLFDQLAHQSVMILLTCSSLLGLAAAGGRPGIATLGAVLLVALLAVSAFFLLRAAPRDENPLLVFLSRRAAEADRLRSLFARSHEVASVFSRLLADRSLPVPAVALGLAYFGLSAAAQWAVFRALGGEVACWQVVLAVAIGNAAGAISGTPGGLGTTEAAMIGSFAALGVERLDAIAATLVFRGLHYAVVLGLGVPSLLVLEIRRRLRS